MMFWLYTTPSPHFLTLHQKGCTWRQRKLRGQWRGPLTWGQVAAHLSTFAICTRCKPLKAAPVPEGQEWHHRGHEIRSYNLR
jgi:hypothetical protein